MANLKEVERLTGPVSVQIFGQVYRLRGPDAADLQDLGALVDDRMNAVSSTVATADTLRIAVLAALNIADELNEERKRNRDLQRSLQKLESGTRRRASTLASLLDSALDFDEQRKIAV